MNVLGYQLPMNHAHLYCKTLESVSREELVNALHQSLMQLGAAHKTEDLGTPFLDHRPAIAESTRILVKAGHIGFTPQPLHNSTP